MKHFITTFLCVAAVLVVILFFPSGLTVHAAFSGHSSGETREELHQDTIAVTVNDDAPAITFLTHGLGGSSGDWSNSMHRNAYNEWVGSSAFSYDSDSIIEKIRNQIPSGIKLYRAEMHNPETTYSFSTDNFTLYKCFLDNESNPTAYIQVEETIINDFSQHVVVAFDLQDKYDETNAQVYEELDYIIDQISYDYLVVMGNTPKINLIGHSRGGLINMDYAIDHPKNVATIISLGTPYNGSWYDNWFADLFIDDFSSVGGADIVSTTLISARKNNWNSVYNQNTHINFHAISGTTELSTMEHIIWEHNYLEDYIGLGAETGIRAAFLYYWPLNLVGGLLPGDVCVDKPSQQAEGYSGVTSWNKNFTDSNSNCNKRSKDTFPVPHNLETYDSDIHDYIFNNATFGAPFDTTNIGLSEIRIDNANFTVRGIYSIPATIGGKAVVAISNSAFSNQNQMSQITIPASITNIGSNAFENCTSLINVALPSNLTSIGSSAFKGCSSLGNITIPNSVTIMDSSAFKEAGANGILIAEPAAGLLSPALCHEFSTNYVKEICQQVKDHDFIFIYHNCGNVFPLLSSILTIDADAYHFGEATNLIQVLENMPKDKLVLGNINPSQQFLKGTPKSIYDETTKLLNNCRHFDQFILSSGCDIPPLAPINNIKSFFQALQDFKSQVDGK